MAETLKLRSSTRFSRSAERSNIQGSAISRVEKGNRMSLRRHQTDLMTELRRLARPIARRGASFHVDTKAPQL